MCYTCGCKLPYDNHGDNHNLIEGHFHDAGETEAIGNAGRVAAKENVLEMLRLQKVSGQLDSPRQNFAVNAAAPITPGFEELGEVLAVEEAAVAKTIQDWPQPSQEAAQIVMDTYGPPDEVAESVLIWHRPGPWKRIIAYREFDQHDFPAPHTDSIESFIEQSVPINKLGSVVEFDGSIIYSHTSGELSARCHDEQANFLALNLAHDLIKGNKDINAARDYYAKEFLDYRRKKPTPYMKGLKFMPSGGPDKGERNISDDELQQAIQEGESKQ